MKISIEHLLDIIDKLPKEVNFDYIIPGKNKAVLISVDHDGLSVAMEKRSEDGARKSAGMTTDTLRTIVDNTFERVPFSVDSIFNGSGSARSTWEAILANTSEFYTCKVNNQKHLIWVPESPHDLGHVVKYDGEFQERPHTEDNHVIEPLIADYITQYDEEQFSTEELAEILKKNVSEAKADSKTFAIHNFGIRYAPHITNGSEVARLAGVESFSASITDAKKIGLNLRRFVRRYTAYRFSSTDIKLYSPFLTALRTKPFLLLAGISGTGKSQKVQELAFMTCPKNDETHNLRDPKSTTPGNYQLVEVKPNWHDSTELLGYYSALSGKYELTDFIRFTYKALQNTDVPFFLCLDEMNLAPVEQYFAEFLSVLETRKRVAHKDEEGKTFYTIETQPLLTKDKFSNCELMKKVLVKEDGDILEDGKQYKMEFLYSEKDSEIIEYLKENGLHLPDNLFVIGTVNMDDTTHQFSRKVIDRAFTIEMNGGKMGEMFTAASKTLLEYREEPLPLAAFQSRLVRAYEVLDDAKFSKYAEKISKEIPALLGDSDGTAAEDSINGILNNTPFRVSYRVQNELVLYLSVLIENADFPDEIDELIGEATLAILLEKVLPRVQGEQKQLETKGGKSNILKDMTEFVKRFAPKADENGDIKENPLYTKVVKKLEEMDGKLTGYYTNFF